MTTPSTRKISSNNVVIFIICVTGVMSQFATDSYIPSMPSMAEYFAVAASAIKLTVGVYFLGMTSSVLLFGYLSDKFGRKNILVLGYVIFCIASVGCTLAQSEHQLLFFRFIQGIGMGSAFVSFRAIMSDVFSHGPSLAKASLVIGSVVSFTPPLAPITGGLIQELIGWRGNFGIHLVLASITILLIVKCLHLESIPKYTDNIFKSYKNILKNKSFVLNAICGGLGLGLVFIFLTLSPFFFQVKMGFSPIEFSFVSAGIILPPAFFLIIFKNKISKMNMDIVMVCCGITTLIGALALAASYFVVGVSPMVVVILCALTFCGNAFQFTASYMCAYKNIRSQIGVASATYGFIQISTTTIFSLISSTVYLNNQIGLGLLMAVPPLFIILLKIVDLKVLLQQ
ncbi:MAG: DHA1 family bicyclomycin/chloramphenicol resistance-like MFS transporter [Francisella sp.]|jgi:DHA1 family bicyclomycin/chloramphenicol resistance-like MFS transporter